MFCQCLLQFVGGGALLHAHLRKEMGVRREVGDGVCGVAREGDRSDGVLSGERAGG